jgi:hypothetical protein
MPMFPVRAARRAILPVLCRARVLQHRVTTTYRYERPPRRERQQPAGAEVVVFVTARAPLPRGVPMLSVQDDLAPASGILIGVSIGTAVWEVAIFIVWHFM